MDETKTNVGVLDKAVAILRVFVQGEVSLSPQEIAVRSGLPLPTVYRLAQALSEHGMLEKDENRFRLGLILMHLGALVAEQIDIRRQALPHLRWLNEQTQENAELHVRKGDVRIVVEMVRSSQSLRPFADIGTPIPLHLGAAGKVLLAWLPAAESRALASHSATHFPSEQTFDEQKLQEQLQHIRSEGWAFSEGERAPGVAALAAPIFDLTGTVVGAITLTAPALRLSPQRRQQLIPLVYEAAVRLSSELGFSGKYSSKVATSVKKGS